MTQFNDRVRVGTGSPPPNGTSPGGEMSPVYVQSVVPLTAYVDNLAAVQTASGNTLTLRANTGLTTEVIDGVTYYKFDTPRCVQVKGQSSSTAGVQITLTGRDYYKRALTSTFSGPTGSGTAQISPKAFMYVRSATISGNAGSGLSLGTSDTLGLNYMARAFEELLVNYNGGPTLSSAFTSGDPATATALTGDVRGRIVLPQASDGVKRLTAFIYLADPDSREGLYGKEQA